MNEGEIRKLAQLSALNAEVEALKIDALGMVAENEYREMKGESQAYGEDEFAGISARMMELAYRIKQEI